MWVLEPPTCMGSGCPRMAALPRRCLPSPVTTVNRPCPGLKERYFLEKSKRKTFGKDDDMKCSKDREKPRVAQCPARPPSICCQHVLFLEEGVFGRHKSSWMNFNAAWCTFHLWQASPFVLRKHWQTLSWHPLFTFFFCCGHKYVPPVSHSSSQHSYNPHLSTRHPTGTLFSVHVPQQILPEPGNKIRGRFPLFF